ncbi:unnamed protein product, partial [Nesidiocoris tenuis]
MECSDLESVGTYDPNIEWDANMYPNETEHSSIIDDAETLQRQSFTPSNFAPEVANLAGIQNDLDEKLRLNRIRLQQLEEIDRNETARLVTLQRKIEYIRRDLERMPEEEKLEADRATAVESTGWRKPRQYEFVTRRDWLNGADGRWLNGEGRSARLLDEPESSASRYYADERLPYDGYYNRRSGHGPQKQRIIYYATLPEIVRRPGEWTPPRPIYGGYPNNNPRDNEVAPPPRPPPIDDHFYTNDGGTRVSSSIIGFSDKHDVKPYPPSAPIDDLSTPKFTIIDAEPPYSYRGPPPPDRYDLRYDNRYDQDKYDFDRFDQRYNSHRNYGSPYNGGGDRPFYGGGDRRAGPPRAPEVPLPPLPLTIVRKPLDVRPLDPSEGSRRFTTQGPPVSSPTSTAAPTSTTSTTTGTILASFERSY